VYDVAQMCAFTGRAVVRLFVRLSVGRSVRLVRVVCLAKRFAAWTTRVYVCVMCTPADSIRRGPVSRSRMRFYIYIARRRRIHPPLLHAGRDLNLVGRATFGTVSPAAARRPRARTNYVTALTGAEAFCAYIL